MTDAPKMIVDGPHAERERQVSLAIMYMEDGAFRTAAKIFHELADRIDEHIDACEIEIFGEITTRQKS